MFDFFLGFFLAFPTAALFVGLFVYLIRNRNCDLRYDLTMIKEDIANMQIKLANYLDK